MTLFAKTSGATSRKIWMEQRQRRRRESFWCSMPVAFPSSRAEMPVSFAEGVDSRSGMRRSAAM